VSTHMAGVSSPETGPTVSPPGAGPRIVDSRISQLGGWLGLPIALLVLLIVGAFTSSRFLTTSNLLNVLISMSIVGIVAVGMTSVMVARGMADLSVPGTIATGAIVVLETQKSLGPYLALVVAVIAAGLAGAVNGVLIGYGRANPIIITLGVGTVVLGLAQAAVNGKIVYGDPTSLSRFVNSRVLGIPAQVLIFLAVAALGHFALSRTVWGRWTYAVGSNYSATEASAVPVRRVKASAFVLTAALAGLAGALLGLSLLNVQPVIGTGYEFSSITAVVVGGTSLLGGRGSIPRTVLGLLLVSVLTNILTLRGVSTPAQGLAQGLMIAVAVAVDTKLRKKAGA
jgi:ribose/xylose/arabinose/galactoside ABC-type transport system permease subunit